MTAFRPASCSNFLNDIPHGGRFPAADVVVLPRMRPDGGDGRGHAVGSVSVAADVLAVAVDGDRFLPLHCTNKDVITHVRPLTRAVDGSPRRHLPRRRPTLRPRR